MKTIEELYGSTETRWKRVDALFEASLIRRALVAHGVAVPKPEEKQVRLRGRKLPGICGSEGCQRPRYSPPSGYVHSYCLECKRERARARKAKRRTAEQLGGAE